MRPEPGKDNDTDFERVRHSGGKMTFRFVDQEGGRNYSVGYEGASIGPMAISAIYVLLPQGLPVATVALGGIGSPTAPPPTDGCLLMFMGSDSEGFFGRACPACKRYFRTSRAPPSTYCPYCGTMALTHQFLTEAQVGYVRAFTNLFLEGFEKGQDVTIDLDKLGDKVGANTMPLPFSEERQQTILDCTACRCRSDILGRFGYCPACSHRNSLAILMQDLLALEDRVHNPRYGESERHLREGEWRNIVRDCVSAFDGYGRDLMDELAKLPASPARKRAVGNITFHNPIQAALELKICFDIDLLNGLGQEDQEFLRRRFLRRHVYEHRAGIADQEYIDRSGDSTIRVGQLIRERSGNVLTTIDLVKKLAENFDVGFHSIQ